MQSPTIFNMLWTACRLHPMTPYILHCGGLITQARQGGTADADIDAPEAWDIQTGSPNVVVAVIDTGRYNHVDLLPNVWTNPGEIAGNGIDDDGNGYIDDVNGWNFYGNNNVLYGSDACSDAHGTHTAGTIGAVGNNGTGVVGVNWNVGIMSLKFLGGAGCSGTTANAILAVHYAANNGAYLTSNSWGGGGFSQALKDAIDASGILFMAAAGNGGADGIGDNNDITPFYPASYASANIISVASTTSTDSRSGFSNYGATSVDLGAPGSSILSTTPNNTYTSYNGASMATPHVSVVAALLYAEFPGITTADVKCRILNSVDPIPALAGVTVTGGRLNAYKALTTPCVNVIDIEGSLTVGGSPSSGNPVKLRLVGVGLVGSTTTNGAGAYQFDPVSAGNYRINIRNIGVSAATTVAGNLLIKGSASVGNPVKLINAATGATVSATTDGSGNFSFAGVSPGTYRINIRNVIVP